MINSVKNIRICHPQESNNSRSKGDFFISNKVGRVIYTKFASKFSKEFPQTWNLPQVFIVKLHALVEYESVEIAEKAVCNTFE